MSGFANTLEQAAVGKADPLSWQRLLGGQLTDLEGRYQFVVTKPNLDFGSFQPGGEASDAMRAAINSLEFVRNGHARVKMTGDVQLNDEEFATVAEGMVAGLVGSLALVTLWLTLAVRSWRVVVPIVITLVVGLLLTTGFAAVAVGTLNLISVAFAILFVGIAVDFAIQFSVRFRAQNPSEPGVQGMFEALRMTGEETGHQILVAALATSAGFLAFTPTAFLGVAQLGLIAGVGMMVAFVCTTTLLPALLRICRPPLNCPSMGYTFMRPVDQAIRRFRKVLLAVFAVVAVVGLALVPRLQFDGDPLHTKNPNSEGMRALRLLIDNPQTSPYSAELLTTSLDDAHKQADRLAELPQVHDAMWLGSFVPTDQDQKLPLIQDAASMLLPTLMVEQTKPAPDAEPCGLRLRKRPRRWRVCWIVCLHRIPCDVSSPRCSSSHRHPMPLFWRPIRRLCAFCQPNWTSYGPCCRLPRSKSAIFPTILLMIICCRMGEHWLRCIPRAS